MPSERDIAAFRKNAARNRTPQILSVSVDGSTMTVVFDRPMDDVIARDATTMFRLFVPDDDLWYDWTGSGSSWTDNRTLVLTDQTADGGYDGDELFVRYLSGNIRAKSRYMLSNGERCDRVEIV